MVGWLFILLIREKIYPLEEVTASALNSASITQHFHSWDVAWVTFCVRTVSILRGFSVIAILASMFLYNMYHHAGAVKRWSKRQSGVSSQSISLRRLSWSLLDLSAIVGGILFGIIPLFHAQFLHLFTSTVSAT